MNVELRQIRHAAAVARLGSFARAADELKLSQSALSRSVQALERQIGTPLFVRSASGVMTTDVGRLFLERGQGLLDMAEELDLKVLRHRSLQRGSIVVGAGPGAMDHLAPEAVAAFINENPLVTVELRSASFVDLPSPLRSREIELLVVHTEMLEHESDIEIERLHSHPIVVVGRAGHPLAGRAGLRLEDTMDYPWLSAGRTPPSLLGPLLEARKHLPEPALPQAFPALTCSSVSAVRQTLLLTDGVGLMTAVLARSMVDSGQLVPLLPLAGCSTRYGIVHLKSRPLSPAARILCEKLRVADARAAEDNRVLLKAWFP